MLMRQTLMHHLHGQQAWQRGSMGEGGQGQVEQQQSYTLTFANQKREDL